MATVQASNGLPAMLEPDAPFEGWINDLPSMEQVSALVGSIYDCALDPARWDATLASLKDMLECHGVLLLMYDMAQGRGRLMKSTGIEPGWLDRLGEHHGEIVQWARSAITRNWPADEPQVRSLHLPPDRLAQSRLAREWADPQGIVDAMILMLANSSATRTHIEMGWHRQHGLVGRREIALARLLAPHIRRSVVISDLIDLKTIEGARAHQTLDMLSAGVVMTDAEGTILHANRAAEAMLQEGSPISSARGMIEANAVSATAELQSAIALTNGKEATLGKAGLAVRLTQSGQTPALAHVLPLGRDGERSRLQPKATAAVFVSAASDETRRAAILASAYGLTRMETRLLGALLAGRKLADAAAALDIALTTARTHLDNIFAKTDVSRQSELISLAMRIVL